MLKLFGRKHEKMKSPPETVVPSEKSGQVNPENIDQQRRRILQGIFSVAGLSALGGLSEACTTYEDYTRRFKNNFDYHQYSPFEEGDLEKANFRNQIKMGAEDCRREFQKTMDERLPYHIEIDDVFHLHDQDRLVTLTNKILSEENQQALMQKYPFITAIKAVESPTFPYNYQFSTDNGDLFFSANRGRVVVNDFGQGQSVGMIYNTSEPPSQPNDEYRDCMRTIKSVTRVDKEYWKDTRTISCEGDEGRLEYQAEMVQTFSSNKMPRGQIYETRTFIDFLKNVQSTPVLETFLRNVAAQNDLITEQRKGEPPLPSESFFSLTNIENISELIEIFRLMPANPKTYGMLLRCCLQYQRADQATKDEYRDPVTTLRSGWADCDDFAVVNYFWAYLHKFEPNMTVITNQRNDSHHVFVWYRDSQGRFVVMDNNDVRELDSSYTVDKYIKDITSYVGWKKGDPYRIDFNGPVPREEEEYNPET